MGKSASMHPVGRSFSAIALTFLFLFIATAVTILTRRSFLRPVVPIFYIALSVIYAVRIHDRVADRRVRLFLTLSAGMTVLLAFLRAVKYLSLRAPETSARYVWYLYYLPILAMPTFLCLAAFCHDLHPGKRLSAAYLPAAVSLILTVGMLTNDLHFQAFAFRAGFENWDAEYTRGWLYYITVAWATALLFGAVAVFAHKSRLSACRKLTVIPLLPMIAALGFILLFLFDKQPKYEGINVFEFQEILCFSSACFTECCLSIGLIPSNEGYSALFSLSSVSAAVTNAEGTVVYASAGSALRAGGPPPAATPAMLDENTRLDSAPVRGGRVYWQDDLTQINRINEELAETESRLLEESALITLQNKLKTDEAKTREQNRVYDLIAQSVRDQSERIAALAKSAQGTEDPAPVLTEICFYAAYIKRRANLTLLYENGERAAGGELIFALDESLRALSLQGLPSLRTGILKGTLTKEEALGVYDAFEELSERSLPTLSGLHAAADGKTLRLSFENAQPGLSEKLTERLKSAGVRQTRLIEDGGAFYTFYFGREEAK